MPCKIKLVPRKTKKNKLRNKEKAIHVNKTQKKEDIKAAER
jgi:hypothetical protein